jgi:hypothetical protein
MGELRFAWSEQLPLVQGSFYIDRADLKTDDHINSKNKNGLNLKRELRKFKERCSHWLGQNVPLNSDMINVCRSILGARRSLIERVPIYTPVVRGVDLMRSTSRFHWLSIVCLNDVILLWGYGKFGRSIDHRQRKPML